MASVKTVLIVSANKEDNLGDQLIYQSLKEQLELADCQVISLNYRLQYYRKGGASNISGERSTATSLLKRFTLFYIITQLLYFLFKIPSYTSLIKLKVRAADKVVIGGGQLIIDSPKNILNCLNLALITIICRCYKKKIIFLGIGIAETLNFSISRWLFAYCLKKAHKILCRDTTSLVSAISLVKNTSKIELSYDLAILNQKFKLASPARMKPKKIGISTLAYYDPRYFPIADTPKFEEYKSRLSRLIDFFLQQNFEVVLIPTTGIDSLVANEIDSQRTQTIKNHNQLISEIQDCDYFLATRMHSYIIATCLGRKSIVLNWDKKILGYCETISGFNALNNVFDFSELNDLENLQEKLMQCDNLTIRNQIDNNVRSLQTQINRCVY